MKRKFLTIIFCLLSLTGLQVVSPTPASAWSGHLPQCGAFPYDWQTAIESDSRFNSTTSWVAFKRSWGGPPFYGYPALVVLWSPTPWTQINFEGNGVDDTSNGLNMPHSATYYEVKSTGLDDITSSLGYGWSSMTPADVTCVQDVHNVNYSYNWRGLHYNDKTDNDQGPFTYVAMGDSFSSGEGNPKFEEDTDSDGANECHRSSLAYPRLLQNDPSLSLGRTAFVACSGATTSNVLFGGSSTGAWSEDPQVDALSSDTEVVTLTIGGNDIGFGDYAFMCATWECGPTTLDYGIIMDAINDPDFFYDLVVTYEVILNKAPNAEIYVVDYPFLAPSEDADTCGGDTDLSGSRAVISQLNAVIDQAVDEAVADPRLHYVDTNAIGSPFVGKDLCAGASSDFNGPHLVLDHEYSFHPNVSGHQDYASLLKSIL